MNLTDKQELDKCRQEMWKQFQTVALTEDDGPEIEKFIEAMDKHQEILSNSERRDER